MFAFDCLCQYSRDVVDMILGSCFRFSCGEYQTVLSFRPEAERYMGGGEQDSLRQSELVCTQCGEQLLEVAKSLKSFARVEERCCSKTDSHTYA
jgi:hypothetical protein